MHCVIGRVLGWKRQKSLGMETREKGGQNQKNRHGLSFFPTSLCGVIVSRLDPARAPLRLLCSLLLRRLLLTHISTSLIMPPPSLTHSLPSLTHSLPFSLTHWLTDSLTHWLTDSLTHWPTDPLTHWLTDPLTHWPTDSLTYWLTDSLTHWLTDSLTHWLTHSLTRSLTHSRTSRWGHGCLSRGRRSTQRLLDELRRAWPSLGPRLPFAWHNTQTSWKLRRAWPPLDGCLSRGKRSTQSLLDELRRTWPPLGPRLPFAWQAQYTEPPGGAAAHVAAAGAVVAFRVAGAVHRASWGSCGARGCRWGRGYLSRGKRSTQSLLEELRRAWPSLGPRLPFAWQAQSHVTHHSPLITTPHLTPCHILIHNSSTSQTSLITAPLLIPTHHSSTSQQLITTHHSSIHHHKPSQLHLSHFTYHIQILITTHHNSSQIFTSQLITAPLLTPHFSHAYSSQLQFSHLTYHTTTHHSSTSHTIFHTPSLTHHLLHTIFDTHNFVTHHLWHTIFHTPLRHTHNLSHTTLSHTIFHTPSCTHTHSFVTHHLPHTIFRTPSFTLIIFHTQLCHTPPPPLSVLLSPSPLQHFWLIIGRSWLVGLSGPFICLLGACTLDGMLAPGLHLS